MSDHTYRIIEIVGSSPDSIDAAIRNAISRASETMRGLDWFEVESIRGHLEDGAIRHFQVTLRVGLRLEVPDDVRPEPPRLRSYRRAPAGTAR